MTTSPSPPIPITIGYIRVSTIDQAERGVSLEAQERAIIAYCTLNDFPSPEIVRDEGESGKDLHREGIAGLLELVKSDKVNIIIVYKLDRLSRNVMDTLATIQLFEDHHVSFHSITEKIDTSTAVGRFFITIISAFAQMERDVIRERVKFALQHKRSQGQRIGTIPYGYMIVGNDGKKLVKNKVEQGILEIILLTHRDKMSYNAISRLLNGREIKTRSGGVWYAETIRSIIQHHRGKDV